MSAIQMTRIRVSRLRSVSARQSEPLALVTLLFPFQGFIPPPYICFLIFIWGDVETGKHIIAFTSMQLGILVHVSLL